MEDREFTFEQIVGADIRMVPFSEEEFFCTDDYKDLWKELKLLTDGSFDFNTWTDETVEEYGDPIKMRLTIRNTVWDIELKKQIGFIDFRFVDKLNEIIETLNLSENRFREVCPEGLDTMSNADQNVFLPKEVVEKLDINGYGKWDKKWIGL
ncbi:hypothetical protein [Spirosoma fluminis]